MDKSIYIGTATCVISIAIGAGIQIMVGIGGITQANAIYFLIGAGVLFLTGIGFLVYGLRLKPKVMPSISTVSPQLGTIPKTTNPSTHKLVHALICEIVGVGLMVWGAFIVIDKTLAPTIASIGVILLLFGLGIFSAGIVIGVSK
ncbi:MAG: hypothetical protein MUP49_00455 [Dehalococcoidia bacterium]|nr:hypothetical protein [Dehalococcoidia bacterium]